MSRRAFNFYSKVSCVCWSEELWLAPVWLCLFFSYMTESRRWKLSKLRSSLVKRRRSIALKARAYRTNRSRSRALSTLRLPRTRAKRRLPRRLHFEKSVKKPENFRGRIAASFSLGVIILVSSLSTAAWKSIMIIDDEKNLLEMSEKIGATRIVRKSYTPPTSPSIVNKSFTTRFWISTLESRAKSIVIGLP